MEGKVFLVKGIYVNEEDLRSVVEMKNLIIKGFFHVNLLNEEIKEEIIFFVGVVQKVYLD